MATAWRDYQEEAASFFRSLGLDASTNVTLAGVRTSHDIDVLVMSRHVGFEITWLVECKHWKTRVSKLHVLALREIVADVGADRGIILCEVGFQSGAVEAANLTNVKVTSLAEVSKSAKNDVYSMRLRELYDRVEDCSDLYWDIPKYERIEHGLRPEVGQADYSGAGTIELCRDLLSQAFRGLYPFRSSSLHALYHAEFPLQFGAPEEVVKAVEPMVSELEQKLSAYMATRQDN